MAIITLSVLAIFVAWKQKANKGKRDLLALSPSPEQTTLQHPFLGRQLDVPKSITSTMLTLSSSDTPLLSDQEAGSVSPRVRAPAVLRHDKHQARGEALEMASRCLRIHV